MKIGEAIKRIRKAKGISQMELADRIGITYQQIQKYEKGKSKITVERLVDIAKALNVSVRVFFSEIEDNRVYSEEEIILVELYKRISNPELQNALLKIIKGLSEK